MKRIWFVLLTLAPLFSGCYLLDEMYTGETERDSNLTEACNWAYTSSNDMYIVPEYAKTVAISGSLGGKTLYYATVNTSDTDIARAYVKYIYSSSRSAEQELTVENQPEAIATGSCYRKNSMLFQKVPDFSRSASRAVTTSVTPQTVTPISEYVDGTTQLDFWCWLSNDESQMQKKTGTLRAHNDICNVWVIDDYFGTSNDSQVTADVAQEYADKFASLYPVERYIYGNESDKMIISPSALGDMSRYSRTGTKVNILVYDINGDYADDAGARVYGFFAPYDYCVPSMQSDSNAGKYLVIDSALAKKDENGDMVATIVHEYQHMINFGVKYIGSNGNQNMDTNINEMLSMLAEDMMQDFLGYTDEATPKMRFGQFNYAYYGAGIRQYNDATAATTLSSYANAYAFGAWLTRQYGGAALVQEMMSNAYVNNECIVKAVNALNGNSYTFDQLFGQFIKACYADDTYSFNQDAGKTVTYSSGSVTYRYPMTAINLWESGSIYDYSSKNVKDSFENSDYGKALDSTYNFLGPAIFGYQYTLSLNASYGMTLHRYKSFGLGTTGTTLTFATADGNTAEGMKVILYIK